MIHILFLANPCCSNEPRFPNFKQKSENKHQSKTVLARVVLSAKHNSTIQCTRFLFFNTVEYSTISLTERTIQVQYFMITEMPTNKTRLPEENK